MCGSDAEVLRAFSSAKISDVTLILPLANPCPSESFGFSHSLTNLRHTLTNASTTPHPRQTHVIYIQNPPPICPTTATAAATAAATTAEATTTSNSLPYPHPFTH